MSNEKVEKKKIMSRIYFLKHETGMEFFRPKTFSFYYKHLVNIFYRCFSLGQTTTSKRFFCNLWTIKIFLLSRAYSKNFEQLCMFGVRWTLNIYFFVLLIFFCTGVPTHFDPQSLKWFFTIFWKLKILLNCGRHRLAYVGEKKKS